MLLLERVPGQNLAEYTERKPLELDRFFSIAIQLSEVVDRIHCRRVIHRDIKPTNILIDPETGRVCLADFGISVLLDAWLFPEWDALMIWIFLLRQNIHMSVILLCN